MKLHVGIVEVMLNYEKKHLSSLRIVSTSKVSSSLMLKRDHHPGEACRTDLDRRGTSRTPPRDFRRPMTTFPMFIIQNYIISVGSNKIIHSVVKTRPSNWFELLVNGDGLRFSVVRSEVVILRANG